MLLLDKIISKNGINDWRCVEFNEIKKISLKKWNKTLRIIRFEMNAFHGLENVEELCLSENKMNKIESNLFQYLNNLKKLDLFSNQIEQIDSNGFQGLNNLEELNLWGNKLS